MPFIPEGQEKLYQMAGPSLYEKYVSENPPTAKPTYAGSYEGEMGELYDRITSREPFSYDAAKDPLYQAYKDEYIQGGKLAMKDTMGQAAALTGGYGSTYGQSVGQQTYDAYLKNLTDVIPTLYGMAYDQYKDQGDQLLKQYGLLGDLRDQEYGRYRDALGDWEGERAYAAQLEAEDYKRRTAAENTAYNRQQDAYANLYAAIKASGYVPSDYELQAAGMTRAAADAIAAEYQRGVSMDERTMALKEWSTYNAGGGGSSGGGSGGGRSGGGGGGSYSAYDPYLDNDTGSLADWWNASSAAGYSDNVLYKKLEQVYSQDNSVHNYGPEGDTMATPTTDAGKARLEKLKKKMANK